MPQPNSPERGPPKHPWPEPRGLRMFAPRGGYPSPGHALRRLPVHRRAPECVCKSDSQRPTIYGLHRCQLERTPSRPSAAGRLQRAMLVRTPSAGDAQRWTDPSYSSAERLDAACRRPWSDRSIKRAGSSFRRRGALRSRSHPLTRHMDEVRRVRRSPIKWRPQPPTAARSHSPSGKDHAFKRAKPSTSGRLLGAGAACQGSRI